MDDFISQVFDRLIDGTDLNFKRYLFKRFQPGRLTGLVGARGVGKTTLMLQYIKENLYRDKKVIYFSADAVYFNQNTLVQFVSDLYRLEGIRFFFIDEIHQYANWNQELKNLYDAFPDIHLVYSGSSMLALVRGSHDLSRRSKMYQLYGMSFREYLNYVTNAAYPSIDYHELLSNPKQHTPLMLVDMILGHFKHYLQKGYYPFLFEDELSYYERVLSIVDKIIYEDIPNYYDLKTHNLHLFKKILGYLASMPPGEVNTNNSARYLNIANQTMAYYLEILDSVGLIKLIYGEGGGNQYLRKPQKIFIHNTTLLHALQKYVSKPIDTGTIRELSFIQSIQNADIPIFYTRKGDYKMTNTTFEIGGKNKSTHQIRDLMEYYLVKDDTLSIGEKQIPLFLFGFLY